MVAASCLIFLTGVIVSGTVFYRGKRFDANNAVISDFVPPDNNPNGYGALAAATSMVGILLAAAAAKSYRRLKKERAKLTLAGAFLFALGSAAAIMIGILAPFTRGYSPLHIQLAFAAFFGICGGLLLHLLAARGPAFLIALQGAALVFLALLYCGVLSFSGSHLVTSLAFWEWTLCADCAAGLWTLACLADRSRGRKVCS